MQSKIIVSPFGGSGTVPLWKKIKFGARRDLTRDVCLRPDFVFTQHLQEYSLDDYPDPKARIVHQGRQAHDGMLRRRTFTLGDEWKLRTGFDMDSTKTIGEHINLAIQRAPGYILLFGKCSLVEPFLTMNNYKAVCFVRHPLYAYDSFLASRHPQWAEPTGGVNSHDTVVWYAKNWVKVVEDFLSSGNPILQYETLVEDLEEHGHDKLANILRQIWKPTMQCKWVHKEYAMALKDVLGAHPGCDYSDESWNNYL